MSLLEVKQLNFSINNQPIIANFSLSVNTKEIVGILGESGSGKSTLLRLIAGLEQPQSGDLLLANKRIIPPSEKLIAGHQEIKLVRQDYGLFPNISLRENIAYELRFYEEQYRNYRVDKLLKVSGLFDISERLPREVSGGEQQRAVIARALADEPKLLLLDEPFSHLDRLNKERLKKEILAVISEEQNGCIFVTHEVADAFGIADKLVVIEKGKILQKGNPQLIYNQPEKAYIAEITGACNLLSAEQFKLINATAIEAEMLVLIRPEWFIPDKSGVEALVRSCTFVGHFYVYEIEIMEQTLQWFSTRNYSVGKTLKLAIEKYHVFKKPSTKNH